MKRHTCANDGHDGAMIAATDATGKRCRDDLDHLQGMRRPVFVRIGPKGVPASRALLEKIAKAMTGGAGAHEGCQAALPGGIALLGRFIDRDLTFDRAPPGLATGEVDRIPKGHAPAFDLDSVYGRYKLAPCGMRLSEDGARRRLGLIAIKGQTLIDDAEETGLNRLHLAFVRFHNRLVDRLEADEGMPAAEVFEAARAQVTRYYQRALKTRFLPRIVDRAVLADVFNRGRRHFDIPITVQRSPTSSAVSMAPGDRMAIPVEFSVSAYGLGYGLMGAGAARARPAGHDPAFQNLARANLLELASGQQMADLFGAVRLSEREILEGCRGAGLAVVEQLSDAQRSELVRNTPLWFYVLREAELNRGLLGDVGGRIVAEVFHRAMEVSRYSILRPREGKRAGLPPLLND